MKTALPSRRSFLATAAASLAMLGQPGISARADGLAGGQSSAGPDIITPSRVAVLDWGLTATCLMLGVRPVGVPAIDYYNSSVGEPLLPPGTVDVGLLFTPNYELLQELQPDCIIAPPALQPAFDLLRHIAPVKMFDLSSSGDDCYGEARRATQQLAALLGCSSAAETVLGQTSALLADARRKLRSFADNPVYVASLLDERHVLVYGRRSLFGAALDQLGIGNAWDDHRPFANLGIDALSAVPQASILLIDGGVETGRVDRNSFWMALPAVQSGHVYHLPTMLVAGGICSIQRFTRLMVNALQRQR